MLLSACAGTGPAPVVDLNQPPTRLASPEITPIPGTVETSANPDVVVSALGDGGAEPRVIDEAQTNGSAAATAADSDTRSQDQNPAVVSLLNRANRDQQNGNFVRAAASLERALKIQPDNAWLWHRLALARLQQGLAGQAAALAAKSNTLIEVDANTNKRQLMAKNWLLIAKVHAQRGEHIAARAATARARSIQSGAG